MFDACLYVQFHSHSLHIMQFTTPGITLTQSMKRQRPLYLQPSQSTKLKILKFILQYVNLYYSVTFVCIVCTLSSPVINVLYSFSGSSVMLAMTPRLMPTTPLFHAPWARLTKLLGYSPSPGKPTEWPKLEKWMPP